jgi:hypothetical protein
LRHEPRPAIAGAAGYQNLLKKSLHVPSPHSAATRVVLIS